MVSISDPELTLCTRSSTLGGYMIETETGYYLQFHEKLYYMDKPGLDLLVPLCTKPNCDHSGDSCTISKTSGDAFYMRDGRLYFLQTTEDPGAGSIYTLKSAAPDGSDLCVECRILIERTSGSSFGTILSPDAAVTSYSYLMGDRYYLNTLLLTVNGENTILQQFPSEEKMTTSLFAGPEIRGTHLIVSEILSGSEEYFEHYYRLEDDKLEEVPNLKDYNLYGAYLDGNTLYHTVAGDGSYVTDLNTGESVKRTSF